MDKSNLLEPLLHSVWQGMLLLQLRALLYFVQSIQRRLSVITCYVLCLPVHYLVQHILFFIQPAFTGAESTQVFFYRVDRVTALAVPGIKKSPEYFWSLRKELFSPAFGVLYKPVCFNHCRVWAIFFFIHFIKMFTGIRYVHRLRKRQAFPVTQEWKERLFTISRVLVMRIVTA